MKKVYYRILQALFIRLLYLSYALGCIWRATYVSDNKYYWLMMIGIGFLLIETGILIWLREGKEFKGFLPSVLFFLSSVLPSIWILKIDEAYRKTQFYLISENGLEFKLKEFLRTMDENITLSVNSSNQTSTSDFRIDYWFKDDVCENLFQQSLLLLIVFSRWFTTQSKINLKQRMNILVISVAIAADMLNFSSYFNIDLIYRNKNLLYTGLGIFSLSLLQFVYLWVDGDDNNRLNDDYGRTSAIEINNPYEDTMKGPSFLRQHSSLGPPKYDRIFKQHQHKHHKSNAQNSNGCLDNLFQSNHSQSKDSLFLSLLTGLFLHDGSYLAFRIFLLTKLGTFEVLNLDSSFIFFMIKNIFIILIQLYRVYKLTGRNRHKNGMNYYRNFIISSHGNNNFNQKPTFYPTTNPYRFAQIYANVGNGSLTLAKAAPFVQSAVTLANPSFYEQQQQPGTLFTPKSTLQKHNLPKRNDKNKNNANAFNSESVLAIMANDYQTRKQHSFNSQMSTTLNLHQPIAARVGKALYGLPFLSKSKSKLFKRDGSDNTMSVYNENKLLKSSKI